MALINCPECGKKVSDKAQSCPDCGCPIKVQKTKLIIKGVQGGLWGFACHYEIFDDNKNLIKKLKQGEVWSTELPDEKKVYYACFSGGMGEMGEFTIEPNVINRYSLSRSNVLSNIIISKVDVIDTD